VSVPRPDVENRNSLHLTSAAGRCLSWVRTAAIQKSRQNRMAEAWPLLRHTCAAGAWRVRPGTKRASEKSPHKGLEVSTALLPYAQLPRLLCNTLHTAHKSIQRTPPNRPAYAVWVRAAQHCQPVQHCSRNFKVAGVFCRTHINDCAFCNSHHVGCLQEQGTQIRELHSYKSCRDANFTATNRAEGCS
jgi:hypothetical protein